MATELEEKMKQRGLEKLSETKRFVSFDGAINTGDTKYVYGKDFFIGDYVTVYSKELNRMIDVQIVSVTKSISNGVEYLDITFGYDNLSIRKMLKGGI